MAGVKTAIQSQPGGGGQGGISRLAPGPKSSFKDPMLIAWTSVPTKADADRIASEAIERGLAVCVQTEGPLTSRYRWNGKIEVAEEYRLMFKVIEERSKSLEAFVLGSHPYATPEWLVTKVEHVSEKYLSWARSEATNRPL
jgi:periplasmic divalent cation tolerance protein